MNSCLISVNEVYDCDLFFFTFFKYEVHKIEVLNFNKYTSSIILVSHDIWFMIIVI